MASVGFMGRGDKNGADDAAVNAMRTVLSSVPMDGIVVIGEGEKDEAPMLFNGERIGDGTPPQVDIAVDPIDGTTLRRQGPRRRARSHRALRARHHVRPGTVRLHGEDRRRPGGRGSISIKKSATENLHALARQLEQPVRDLIAVILDRAPPRPARRGGPPAGARVRLISDGDVAGAISTAWEESDGDILFGIGGTPEGVIAAAALKCLGGRDPGPAVARNDERAPRGDHSRATTSTRCSRPTTSSRATTASSPRPGSPTGSSCAACASTTTGRTPRASSCARSRDRPQGRRLPPPGQAPGDQRRRLLRRPVPPAPRPPGRSPPPAAASARARAPSACLAADRRPPRRRGPRRRRARLGDRALAGSLRARTSIDRTGSAMPASRVTRVERSVGVASSSRPPPHRQRSPPGRTRRGRRTRSIVSSGRSMRTTTARRRRRARCGPPAP